MTNYGFQSALESAMQAHGFSIKGNINYNSHRIQRFRSATSRSGKDVFVALHADRGATFGDWHDRDGWTTWWHDTGDKMPDLQKQIERAAIRRAIDKRNKEARAHAEHRAWSFWCSVYLTSDTADHPYVIHKRIRAYYARHIRHYRWIRDVLVIPIRNVDYDFVSVQIIKWSHYKRKDFKRFWKGTSPAGNMAWLCEKLHDGYYGKIRICEGYATGCTIYEAVGEPVVCALNAYNVPIVASALQKRYPLAILIICADDDAWDDKNPGVTAAIKAMQETGAVMRLPDFTGLDITSRPTDFNDLLCIAGIGEVERQLAK
jgi:putative DNA primase/helicase